MGKREKPGQPVYKGKKVDLDKLFGRIETLEQENKRLRKDRRKALRRYRREQELRPYEAELIKLQEHLERISRPMIILFEGRDAAGKGGAIQRITFYMNPKHYRVVALGRPTDVQRSQWYLQKYISRLPSGGEIILFDRSWYNRAMVEPVFGFCTPEEHENFMLGVKGFERDLVRQGIILVKFYFSVSKKVQAKRFDIRKTNPLKQWKLSEIDLQVQAKWDDFSRVKYEMLKKTHTRETPWTIIRADSKHLARLNAMKFILGSLDYDGRNPSLDYAPDPAVVVSGAEEIEKMSADMLRNGRFIE